MIPDCLRYSALALLTFVAAALAGCSSDSDGPEPVAPADDQLTLRLNLSFGSASSRADKGDDNGYEDPSGDFEKIHRLRVIIVRALNAAGTSGVVEANRLVNTTDEGYPMYDNLEFRVQADEVKRIYLIANENFLTVPAGLADAQPTVARFLDSFEVGKTADLTKLTNWTVSLPGITDATTTVSRGIFSPSSSTRLPLTEAFDVYADRATATDDVCHTNLFMTRAAAKARFFLTLSDNFIDDENAPADLLNTTITAISISGIGTTEYVFPNATEYSPAKYVTDDDGMQRVNYVEDSHRYITDFAQPASAREVTYLISGLSVGLRKPTAATAYTPIGQSPIYFPESILEPGKQYMVSVQLNNSVWLSAPLTTNILSIGGRDAIARDTYLPIELKFNSAADISVRVLPWDREDYYVDYTANIGFADDGYLTITGNPGQNGDYLELDETAGQLVLNYGKVARGSFFISTPVASQWDAYLITTGGTQDAIQFQVPDPDDPTKTITTTHISGKVGVDKADFGIVATVAPGSVQNSAQLMVIVTLANGTPVVADVIGGRKWGTNLDRLTIIENPQ